MISGPATPDRRHPHGAVEVRRVLPAPPEDVFLAWTDPEQLQQWMSPVGTAASHGQGWGQMLDRLAEHLVSKGGR